VRSRLELEEVLLELWQLAGPLERLGADDVRYGRLGVAVLVDVGVDEEVLQRALEAGDATLEHGEARTAQFRRALLVGVRVRVRIRVRVRVRKKGQGQGQWSGSERGL